MYDVPFWYLPTFQAQAPQQRGAHDRHESCRGNGHATGLCSIMTFTGIPPFCTAKTPKRQLLEELNWPSLRWRREIASLCLLHQLLQERPDPLSGTLPQYASTSNTRSPRKPKELILANARTTRYSKSFFFRTSVVWNTLPGHLQQLTSPHQFKLAIREHFHARKFNCLHNFSLTP